MFMYIHVNIQFTSSNEGNSGKNGRIGLPIKLTLQTEKASNKWKKCEETLTDSPPFMNWWSPINALDVNDSAGRIKSKGAQKECSNE